MDKIPAYLRMPIFKKLFNISEYANLTKEEKMLYDSSLKARWDNQNVLDYAVSEARKEALQKGLQEGERKNIQAIMAIAKEMKKEGFTAEQITKLTQLSMKEIKRL